MSTLMLTLPQAPASAGAARRGLRAHLTTVPNDQLDTVILATSEVVANAVLHGEGPVVVQVSRGAQVVHVEVTDQGTAEPQICRDHGDDEESGRGLHMVELLTSRWGVSPASRGPGKTVWFEVDSETHLP